MIFMTTKLLLVTSCLLLLGSAGNAGAQTAKFKITGSRWKPLNSNPKASHFQIKKYSVGRTNVELHRVLDRETGKLSFFSKLVTTKGKGTSKTCGSSVQIHYGRHVLRQNRAWGERLGRDLGKVSHYLLADKELAPISEVAYLFLVANNK